MRGRAAEMVVELERLIAAAPLQERLRGQLMLALYRSGRQAEALAVYRDACGLLRDELGLTPCAELRELEGMILRQDAGTRRRRWRRRAGQHGAVPVQGAGGVRELRRGVLLRPRPDRLRARRAAGRVATGGHPRPVGNRQVIAAARGCTAGAPGRRAAGQRPVAPGAAARRKAPVRRAPARARRGPSGRAGRCRPRGPNGDRRRPARGAVYGLRGGGRARASSSSGSRPPRATTNAA